MELSAEDIKKIQETHESLREVRAVLLGVNGNPGLCKRVEDVCESHASLKRSFWILVGALIGSGVLGASIAGATKLIG